MKSFIGLALAASAVATPLVVRQESCSASYDGQFTITVVNVTSSAKRDVEKRQLAGILTLTLEDGILKDQATRTGYIASNYQFQFDNPPQANAITTSGFSVCGNKSLALDGSAIFYQCYSGGFYNLYDRSWADQCNAIYLVAQSGGSSSSPTPSQITDGQPQVPTAPVSQVSDGQPQAMTALPPISQISDGQPQAPTGAPVTQISDGQPQAPTGYPVSQISDGQPQAPTGAPVTQISDGQPQAPTGPVVSQISDGQPQAPTAAPTTVPAPPVTQITDGQPQAPVATGNIPPNATVPPPAEFTGAASAPAFGHGAFVAALIGMAAIL